MHPLMNIAAVKELNAAGTAEGIRFISSVDSFSVNRVCDKQHHLASGWAV